MMGLRLPLSHARWWIAALLAGLLIGLVIALVLRSNTGVTGVPGPFTSDASPSDLRREIEATCEAFGVGKADIRIRPESSREGEHRIMVEEGFRTLEFHYALSRRVAQWGITIVGDERPREKKVSLRLLREGKQVWSVLLLIQKPSGKEDRH